MCVLNLGSGSLLLPGADNVDMNLEHKAEYSFDIRERFPLEDSTYDEVYFFHTLEHIEKKHHTNIFLEIRRVMKEDGTLFLSYPEFGKCVTNWLNNKDNQRHFWEATIYGRQKFPSDYHVCAIDSTDLKQFLTERGFIVRNVVPEIMDDFNTVMQLSKGPMNITYEELLYKELFEVKL